MTNKGLSNTMLTLCAALIGVAALTQTSQAQASDFSFAVNVDRPIRCEPAPQRRWVPERYETLEERVLVCPAHYRRTWVNETCVTQYDHHGHAFVTVVPGYWTNELVPARYENRCTKVLIPGYWEAAPVVYSGHDHHHNDRDYRWERDGRYDRDYRNDRNSRDVSFYAGYRSGR